MRKNLIPPAATSFFGIGLIITASVLFSKVGALWFWIIFPVGIIVLLAGGYEFFKAFGKREKGRPPAAQDLREPPEYRTKRAMLTKPELAFYRLLQDLLHPDHFYIFPETALVSVIEKLTQTGYRNELFRIADFCIADAREAEPLLLIELNDASHNRADRAERDRKVNEICARAGLPLVTFSLAEAQDINYVKKVLQKYL